MSTYFSEIFLSHVEPLFYIWNSKTNTVGANRYQAWYFQGLPWNYFFFRHYFRQMEKVGAKLRKLEPNIWAKLDQQEQKFLVIHVHSRYFQMHSAFFYINITFTELCRYGKAKSYDKMSIQMHKILVGFVQTYWNNCIKKSSY